MVIKSIQIFKGIRFITNNLLQFRGGGTSPYYRLGSSGECCAGHGDIIYSCLSSVMFVPNKSEHGS